ncbi:hypothetical protein C0989_008163 [Termitomyces sp. Mn162]|nr:hypothetical protein C0989_008163 [Termitomyces sp. Mn162]
MNAESMPAIADDEPPKIDDLEIDDDQGCVETNVIKQGSASASSHESTMPAHSDVATHSPPKEKILGTPFTTDSRFEYPFPNTSNDPSPSTLILSSPISPLESPIPAPSSYAHPINNLSAPGGIASFSPLFSFPTYTLIHPKMRATPPPIPPSLKKRQRWSLTIPLLRRRSSQPNDNTAIPGETKETRSASMDITPASNAHSVIQNF